MHASVWFWVLFNSFVLLMLVLDLAVFHRQGREIRVREALLWTIFWIGLAVAFGVIVRVMEGSQKALEFATGYIIEESLSLDNLFIFLLIFRYFKVPGQQQHRVLFWGIIGALLMRGIFIAAGVGLIRRFHWIIYVFGAFLIYTGIRMMFEKEKEIHPERNPVLGLFRRFFKVTDDYSGGKFLVTREGRRWATPLLIVLVLVESTDLLFATDSIPAVLAITTDPFIVYTSNVFAILGLRSLYFALAGLMRVFRYLHYGISAILVFVGGKMVASEYWRIPTHLALAIIGAILAVTILLSVMLPEKESAAA
jgi:tellurite resistance protein TerC